MRILLLSPARFAEGGAERSARLLVTHLVNNGHQVRVLGVEGSALPAFAALGAQTAALPTTTTNERVIRHGSSQGFLAEGIRSAPRVAAAVGTLAREIRRYRPHIIYSNGARTHVLSVSVPTSVPIVWALRDVPPRGLQSAFLRLASRRTTLLLANSAFTQDHYRTRGVRSEIVYNPVAAPTKTDRVAARGELSLPVDRPLLALVAHLHPSKGHHVALDALTLWSPGERPFLAIAGGANYPGSEDYRSDLQRRIIELGLSRDVALLGSLRNVDGLYSAADILVHCAVHPEGFGRTIFEAQSAGLAVVATELGAVAELCRHRQDALLIPPGDAAALYTAVDELLTSEDLLASLIAAGKDRVRRFEPELHTSRVEMLLKEVAGE